MSNISIFRWSENALFSIGEVEISEILEAKGEWQVPWMYIGKEDGVYAGMLILGNMVFDGTIGIETDLAELEEGFQKLGLPLERDLKILRGGRLFVEHGGLIFETLVVATNDFADEIGQMICYQIQMPVILRRNRIFLTEKDVSE